MLEASTESLAAGLDVGEAEAGVVDCVGNCFCGIDESGAELVGAGVAGASAEAMGWLDGPDV